MSCGRRLSLLAAAHCNILNVKLLYNIPMGKFGSLCTAGRAFFVTYPRIVKNSTKKALPVLTALSIVQQGF